MPLFNIPYLVLPREVWFRPGSLMCLKNIRGLRAMVICGGTTLKQNGFLQKIVSHLKDAGMKVCVAKEITQEPELTHVQALSKEMSDFSPDTIVAAGGGSVMDAAKLALLLFEQFHLSLQEYYEKPSALLFRRSTQFIAIPTTAGSGSEASRAAVLTDQDAHRKISFVCNSFVPDRVVLDPTLTVSLSPARTCSGVMDAFTHAIESFCSPLANRITEGYAVHAGRLIYANSADALEKPDDMRARESLQAAAFFAGIAQSMTSVGSVHAIAHALGVALQADHGLLNGVFLSSVTRLNGEVSARPLEFLRHIGIDGFDGLDAWVTSIFSRAGVSRFWDALKKTELPLDLNSIGLRMAGDVCARTNPRKFIPEEYADIIKKTRYEV